MRLIISPPDAGRVSFAFGQAAVLHGGFSIDSTGHAFELNIDNCGCSLREDIFAIGSVGGQSIGILDVLETGDFNKDKGE